MVSGLGILNPRTVEERRGSAFHHYESPPVKTPEPHPAPVYNPIFDPVETIVQLVALEALHQIGAPSGQKLCFYNGRISLIGPECATGIYRTFIGTSHTDLELLKEPLYTFIQWSKEHVGSSLDWGVTRSKILIAAKRGLTRLEASYASSETKSRAVARLLEPCHQLLEKAINDKEISREELGIRKSADRPIATRMKERWCKTSGKPLYEVISKLANELGPDCHDSYIVDRIARLNLDNTLETTLIRITNVINYTHT